VVIRDDLYEIGIRQRRVMFGPQGAEARVESTTDLNDKLEDFVTRTTFGDIWQRPGLSLAARSEVTFAMLLANGKEHELRVHAEGALENGVSPIELREIVLQSLLYCGIPAAVLGVRVLREVFEARGISEVLDGEAETARATRTPATTDA
jgi:4-carboxymuconolactone decarboxylase